MSIFPDKQVPASKEIDPSILKIQKEIKKVIKEPIRVYYPGIGGGEAPVDPTSPFVVLDADYVLGIDPFEHPYNVDDLSQRQTSYNFDHVEVDIYNFLSGVEAEPHIKKEENNATLKYTFELYGKPRILEISKIPTDGERYVPLTPFNAIYSNRTVNVVDNLPPEVYRRAKTIYFNGEMSGDAKAVQSAGEEHGFRNIDLISLTNNRGRFYRARLLVK